MSILARKTPSKPRKAIEGGKKGKRGNDDDIWTLAIFYLRILGKKKKP